MEIRPATRHRSASLRRELGIADLKASPHLASCGLHCASCLGSRHRPILYNRGGVVPRGGRALYEDNILHFAKSCLFTHVLSGIPTSVKLNTPSVKLSIFTTERHQLNS
jgi:hypothetical protein